MVLYGNKNGVFLLIEHMFKLKSILYGAIIKNSINMNQERIEYDK